MHCWRLKSFFSSKLCPFPAQYELLLIVRIPGDHPTPRALDAWHREWHTVSSQHYPVILNTTPARPRENLNFVYHHQNKTIRRTHSSQQISPNVLFGSIGGSCCLLETQPGRGSVKTTVQQENRRGCFSDYRPCSTLSLPVAWNHWISQFPFCT